MRAFKPSKRQSVILNMVAQDGFVATEAMVAEFGVTPQTIRRDLNELGREGLLTRFHGGAGQAKSFLHGFGGDGRLEAADGVAGLPVGDVGVLELVGVFEVKIAEGVTGWGVGAALLVAGRQAFDGGGFGGSEVGHCESLGD